MFGLSSLPPRRRPGAIAMLALMAIGSIAMWLGAPIGWIFVASRLQHGTQPSLGPYVLVIVAVPATMVVIARGLGALNRRYTRYIGADTDTRVRLPWMRSMRDARDVHAPRTVLDVMMVGSVTIALLCMAVWFFAFAGSSLPK